MAEVYVRSGAGGAGTGADWANAFTTIAAAMSGKAAGDIFYIAADHAESAAGAATLTSPGTAAAPCKFFCVDHTGSVPPVSADLRATATITRTGASSGLTLAGAWYVDGVEFTCASGATNNVNMTILGTSALHSTFKNCKFRNLTTAIGLIITGVNTALGAAQSFINCVFEWNGTTGFLAPFGHVLIEGGSIAGATVPSTFIGFQARGTSLVIRGMDLSAFGSGKTIMGLGNGVTAVTALLEACKLNAAVTRAGAVAHPGALRTDFVHCGSSGINYDFSRHWYEGVLTTETTIVRTGGASDGTNPIAWKIDTTANVEWDQPFISPPILIWNDTDGSPVTVTVEGIWGGGAVPDNDQIWIEVTYFGDNASPLGTVVRETKANGLAAPTAHASSAASWGGSTTAFKMTSTFTPQQAGLISVRVMAAEPSETFYVDPKITLS